MSVKNCGKRRSYKQLVEGLQWFCSNISDRSAQIHGR